MDSDLTQWLTERLSDIILSQQDQYHFIQASRQLIDDFVHRVDFLSLEERQSLLTILDKWIQTSQVGDLDVSKNKDSSTMLEGILGTMIGIVEE